MVLLDNVVEVFDLAHHDRHVAILPLGAAVCLIGKPMFANATEANLDVADYGLLASDCAVK